MNDDNQIKVMCPRCGNEMNSNSRYCLQCGYLNPNVSENQNMQKFLDKRKDPTYEVGSGQTIKQRGNQITNSIGNNTGNKSICFLVNYSIYMIIIILSFVIIVGNKITDLDAIKNSLFPYVAFIDSIFFLYVYSMELIFMKANKKWWYALVPIYNLFVFCDVVYRKKMLAIILLIPVIGQIFFLVTLYKLAGKFKLNGLLTILLPFIYIPLMGFGSRLYNDVNYISEERTLEKDYKRKRIFFFSIVIFALLSLGIIYWNNIIEIKSKAFRVRNYYYVFATRQIVNKTKQLAEENYLECEGSKYKEDSGIYYVEYADIGEVAYIPLHIYTDVISAYVIIDNTSGSSKYYVSMSDDTFGYPETLYDDITVDSIVPYKELKKRDNVNYCINTKQKINVGGMK